MNCVLTTSYMARDLGCIWTESKLFGLDFNGERQRIHDGDSPMARSPISQVVSPPILTLDSVTTIENHPNIPEGRLASGPSLFGFGVILPPSTLHLEVNI